jgi:RNA polymerase sigma-70 factor, ECF subfamily
LAWLGRSLALPKRKKFSLTNSTPIRLHLIAGLASRQPAVAAARIEPTVTQPLDAIEDHVGSVYRYALRLAGRPDLAEDLTQETFLRGWRNRRKLRDGRAARVWLLRIATNLWTDQLRRGKFRAVPLDSEPPCPHILPREASDHRENVRLALATMDELPPRQRQVLYLVTCESMAQAEVATILGISESAVKANLSLARQEMRRRLKDLYDEVCGHRAASEV